MTRPSFICSHIRKAWKIIKFMQNLEDFPHYLIYSLFSVSVDINHLVFWFPDVQFMGQPAGFRLNMLNRSIAITKGLKIRGLLKHREFEALYGWSTLQTNMEKPYGNWGANLPLQYFYLFLPGFLEGAEVDGRYQPATSAWLHGTSRISPKKNKNRTNLKLIFMAGGWTKPFKKYA